MTISEPMVQDLEVSAEESLEALDEMDFLDDVDFSLEEVESRIAPLALAHG